MMRNFLYRGVRRPGRGSGPQSVALYLSLAVELVLLTVLTVASLRGSFPTVELGWDYAVRKPVAYGALATGAILGMVGTVSLSRRGREPEQQATRERQALAAWAAHQIRNPLAVISGCAQLLSRTESPGGSQDAVRRILEQSMRIDGALAQLTALCEPVHLERAPVDLGVLVEAAAQSCLRDFGGVTWQLGGDFGPVTGDPQLLKEALRNVIINALESLAPGTGTGWVKITGSLSAHGNVITVEDNGCGLLPGEEACVFDIGYTTKPHALGMGLTMARAVLELHGGTICLEPRVGSGPGTRAIISLPFPGL